jgi:hypothetical protein
MSHFTVLVIGNDPEEQLKPFQENNMGDCPREYMAFNDLEEEYAKEYAEETREMVVMEDGTLLSVYDERFKQKRANDPLGGLGFSTSDKYIYPAGTSKRDVPFKEIYPTLEAFAEDWHGSKRDAEKGRFGYWENPNAKWDWHSLGGRWTGMFKMKQGDAIPMARLGRPGLMTEPAEVGHADQARKRDIDWDGMRAAAADKAGKKYDSAIALIADRPFRSWEEIVEHPDFKDDIEAARKEYHGQAVVKELRDADLIGFSTGPEQFRVTREEYLANARQKAVATFAVLKDGAWHERGQMGWWGVVHDEKDEAEWHRQYAALLDSLPDDTLLSVYDCHI